MYSRQEPTQINKQMLVSSPRCSLNCQGLSIHLPPLGGRQDASPGRNYGSPPMSDSVVPQGYDKLSPKVQHSAAEHSISPPSPPSTLGKRSPNSPKAARINKALTQGARIDLSTTAATGIERERKNPGISRLPTSEINRVPGESNDELSANSQESPESHQLMPGVPGVARRAKAHVPSACVNCKKKHLACETKRPCNRCMQTGKESTCVDVQHKKRGRPRLREEESLRGLAFGPEYSAEGLFETQANGLSTAHLGRHRSKTYRELRSLPEASYVNQRPRTSDSHFSQPQYLPGVVYSIAPSSGFSASQHTPTALLTTDFVVAHQNAALSEALSLPFSVRGQTLLDLVVPAEKERIRRLQTSMRAELRDAIHSLAYLSGGVSPYASVPAIETLDIARATSGFQTRSEYWTFRLPCEQSRGFPISISLAKSDTPFVVLTLVQSAGAFSPSTHTTFHHSPVLGSPTSMAAPSPTNGHHPRHHRNGSAAGTMPYVISSPTASLDDQLFAMQPSHSLAQQRHSPPRSVQQVPYAAAVRPDSSSSATSGTSVIHTGFPRSTPAHPNPGLSRDSLRHLQLPPILTTPTSNPLTPGQKSENSRRRIEGGTPSPGRGSPSSTHSGKRKKRRRVEIGDILR